MITIGFSSCSPWALLSGFPSSSRDHVSPQHLVHKDPCSPSLALGDLRPSCLWGALTRFRAWRGDAHGPSRWDAGPGFNRPWALAYFRQQGGGWSSS